VTLLLGFGIILFSGSLDNRGNWLDGGDGDGCGVELINKGVGFLDRDTETLQVGVLQRQVEVGFGVGGVKSPGDLHLALLIGDLYGGPAQGFRLCAAFTCGACVRDSCMNGLNRINHAFDACRRVQFQLRGIVTLCDIGYLLSVKES